MKLIAFAGESSSGKDTAAGFLEEHLEAHDAYCARDAFAYPLKRFVGDVFGWDRDRLWGPSEKRNEPDPALGPAFRGYWGLALESLARETQYVVKPYARAAECSEFRVYAQILLWFSGLAQHVAETGQPLTARYALQTFGTEMGRSLHEDIWVRLAFERAEGRPEGTVTLITDARFDNEFRAVRAQGGWLWHVVGRGGLSEAEGGGHASEHDLKGDVLRRLRTAVIDNGGTLEDLREHVTAAVEVMP